MKKKVKKDRTYSIDHVRQRLLERYQLDITEKDYDFLCQQFINNQIQIVEKEPSNQQVVFMLTFKSKQLLLVWCTQRHLITTALPNTI